MDKETTPLAAWADFYAWVRQQPKWRKMTKQERKRIYDADADSRGTRKQSLGVSRIRKILEEYAPDRYEFRDVVVIKE